MGGREVGPQEGDAGRVVHLAPAIHMIVERRAVFGNVNRGVAVMVAQLDQLVVKAVGFDRPAVAGLG